MQRFTYSEQRRNLHFFRHRQNKRAEPDESMLCSRYKRLRCRKQAYGRTALCSCDLAHYHFNSVVLAIGEYRQHVALDCLAVNGNRYHTLANVVRVLDGNIVGCTTELSGNGEAIPLVGDRRIDLQAVPIRNDTQNVLALG